MAQEIKMPQLSDTMASGKILTWLKKEGETIARGDVIAEVETDKANLQIEAFFPGVLLKIVTLAGGTAKVGDPIAFVGQAGESIGASPSAASSPPPSPATATATAAAPLPPPVTTNSPAPSQTIYPPSPSSGERPKASPLARKIAESHQVNLSLVQGTGPQGRIIKKDVEQAMHTASGTQSSVGASAFHRDATASSPARPPSFPHTSSPQGDLRESFDGSLTPLSKMRETIARRMQESVNTSPHFYVTATITMDEVMRLREALKENPAYKGISLNHFIIKAVAYALVHEPRVNFAIKDGQLYKPPGINIGIITSVGEGLLIPVVHHADTLSMKDLVFEAKAAVERARAGRPSSQDLSGGTVSISNMGMFDVENFTAIINPGQGAILAVSSVKEEPVVIRGAIVMARRMKVTLSVDHRIIDGVMAGTWLKFFKEALETPALLFIEG